MRKKHILFWILFPIGFVLIAALLLFYLDLANGPIWVLIATILSLLLLAGLNVAFLRFRVWIRLFPWAGFLIGTAALMGFAQPAVSILPAVTHENPEVTEVLTIEKGAIQGVYTEDGEVEVYAGIPYAKPPVGEYRWHEPVDVDPWSDVLDCTKFAAKSMQPTSSAVMDSLVDIYAEKSWHPNYSMTPVQNRSEDSLYLNVWKPANEATNLPVLVYIHGGSLTTGSSASPDTNGETLAHQGIIVVTVQYRLGVFGYFAHQDLIEESKSRLGGTGTTGNYGLLDQIKALEWVRDNIGFFGGDKNKVTIAGESAGSSSVSALCCSPLAHGLFRYAIGESSSLITPKAPHTFRSLEKALDAGEKIMAEQSCQSIDQLRAIPAETLVETAIANSSMTLDGYALTKLPYQTYLDGENNEKALLNGYNVKEADAFVVPTYLFNPTNKDNIQARLEETFGGDIAAKIMEVYAKKIEKDAFSAFNEIISVLWFIHPHHSWSSIACQSMPVYRYQFTKENGYHGTYHAGELVYAYGNLGRSGHGYAYDDTDRALSETMVSYWANFVKNGNPNGEGLPTWFAYEPLGETVMELGRRVGAFEDQYATLYPLIDEYNALPEIEVE